MLSSLLLLLTNVGKYKKRKKKNKKIIDNQKLSYFYTPYRKELLADNRQQMSFVSSNEGVSINNIIPNNHSYMVYMPLSHIIL